MWESRCRIDKRRLPAQWPRTKWAVTRQPGDRGGHQQSRIKWGSQGYFEGYLQIPREFWHKFSAPVRGIGGALGRNGYETGNVSKVELSEFQDVQETNLMTVTESISSSLRSMYLWLYFRIDYLPT